MQCSFIQSNFEGFGSGMVIPGTGIALQNRGRGFSLDPSSPNCIGPNKRPFHTIIPGFLVQGELRTAFGVMGGPMQPQGHLQVVCRMVFAKQNPQAASMRHDGSYLAVKVLPLSLGLMNWCMKRSGSMGMNLKLQRAEQLLSEVVKLCKVFRMDMQVRAILGDGRDGQAVYVLMTHSWYNAFITGAQP